MFEEVFMAQRGMLLRTLRRMVGSHSTAEDLLQETYLRVSAALTDTQVEHLAPFLFQTARNLALDHLRGLRRQNRVLQNDVPGEVIEQVPSSTADPELTITQQQVLERLDEALAGLLPRQQQVFMLNRLHGWRYAEIAAHLDISLSTVQKDLKLAMAVCVALNSKLDRD